ncbi:TonB-dependent receptor [Flavicella sp.]|uniref:TonB-dependent receptor n=1 Tax=Flavicella sp. TaxID=2957742 RepID=UPI00301A53F9
MRIIVVLLMLSIVQLYATDTYSQDVKISIKLEHVSIKKAIEKIENLTDYSFIYNQVVVDNKNKVSISVVDKPVKIILEEILKNTNLSFIMVDSQIIISSKKQLTMVINPSLSISGTVLDNEGITIPGVTIVEVGTSNGTVTDFDGNYNINITNNSSVLEFSFIGFITKRVIIGSQININIVLQEDNEILDEVIVVGYSTIKKEDLSGSVAVLSAEDLNSTPVSGVDQALQGRMAGVNVMNSGGQPGNDVEIQVRGVGSFGSSKPLYIVDGFAMDDISTINPGDIESISVLKDAASASIYGSRAANGVVIIKTKTGTNKDSFDINFDSYFGVSTLSKKRNLLNAQQRNQVFTQAAINDGEIPNPYWDTEYPQVTRTDWQDEIFRAASMYKADFTLRRSVNNSNYSFALGYFNQDGILIETNYNRHNFRLNSNHKINDKITVGQNLTISKDTKTGRGENSAGRYALWSSLAMHPDISVYDESGNFSGVPVDENGNARIDLYGEIRNPVGEAKRNKLAVDRFNAIGNVFVEIELFKGLKFKTDIGGTYSGEEEFMYFPVIPEPGSPSDVDEIQNRTYTDLRWQWSNVLTYNLEVGKNRIDMILGQQSERFSQEYTYIKATDLAFTNDNGGVINSAQTIGDIGGGVEEWSMLSYFGRVNYAYNDRYLFQFTLRADASSIFYLNESWGYFPSVSAAWRVSEENFFEPIKDIISNLKVRGSFGELGNSQIGQNYPMYAQMGSGWGIDNGDVTKYFYESTVPNYDLTWERVRQTDIGLDMSLFKGKIDLTADYYNKITDDLLIPVELPAISGSSEYQYQNVGKMRNTGFELALTYKEIKGDFRYSVTGNLSVLQNEVLSLSNNDQALFGSANYCRTSVGAAMSQFFGYNVSGIIQNDDEANLYNEKYGTNAVAGDFMFEDVNGDNVINDQDKIDLGNALPDFTYGLNINLGYKGFDLNIFLQGTGGVKSVNATNEFLMFASSPNNKSTDILDAWTVNNTQTDVPRLSLEDSNNNARFSSYFVEDADYLRLRNVTFGYTFSDKAIESIGFSKLRLYIQGQNLLTFTKYSGWDPEIGSTFSKNSSSYNSLSLGVDRGQYPMAKSFLFGINVGF